MFPFAARLTPPPPLPRKVRPFAGETTWPSVWARDSAGRWHVAAQNGGGFGGGHANVTLRLTPPIHPEATSLEIMLLGKSGRATATVPLAWQDMA